MKKILLIKTSSLGDVIHTLPALTDALAAHPTLQVDWIVEQSFAEIPRLHPAVNRVIPINFRKWRRASLQAWREQHWQNFYKELRTDHYDLVLDAQGLLKSALITLLARGKRCGLDWASARESFASIFYQTKCRVIFKQQAVDRTRQLFAQAFDYALPNTPANYGLLKTNLTKPNFTQPYIIFLHGTTWENKHWPENYWLSLAKQIATAGLTVLLPWGNDVEQARAQRIAVAVDGAQVLPKSSLLELANLLGHAKAVVAVDTGLGHLAAALAVPTISLYGPTDPEQTGTVGESQQHLAAQFPCAPCLQRHCTYRGPAVVEPACFGTITPEQVWEQLQKIF